MAEERVSDDKEARVISISDGERRKARRIGASEVPQGKRRGTRRPSSPGPARNRVPSAGSIAVAGDDEIEGLLSGILADPRVGRWIKFMRGRLEGRYAVDEFGYDEQLATEVFLPFLRVLYHDYFRVEVHGIENVPRRGPAVLAANHSGVMPIDAAMLLCAIDEEHDDAPVVRTLGSGSIWSLPFISQWVRKTGGVADTHADALRLLRDGEVIVSFPEGSKGRGKPFRERYRLQRFENPEFVKVALAERATIIPVGIVGAEEAYPMLADARVLARLFGLSYFALTPTFPWLGPLGMLPLPTKWIIEFGEPIEMSTYNPEAAQDAMTVFNIADGVRDTIQQILYRNLMHRRTWFW